MSAKHTPGPWYADKIQDRTAYNIFMPGYGSAGASVQHCSNATGCMGPEVEYNARLIAAAPDLLEALQGLLQGVIRHEVKEEYLKHYPEVAAARAAIAKAEGTE